VPESRRGESLRLPPTVNGKQAIRALENFGFRLCLIERSHHMMVKDGHPLAKQFFNCLR
jgi:hypothetical protein